MAHRRVRIRDVSAPRSRPFAAARRVGAAASRRSAAPSCAAEPLVAAVAQEAHRRRARCRRRSRSAPCTSASRPAQCCGADAAARPSSIICSSSLRSWSAKSRIAHEHVGLARHQEAIRIDVRRADRRPAVVDDRDLGVQERAVILLDRDAGRQQLAVQRARRVVQQHGTRRAPAAAASRARRARAAAISARRKRTPGKKYAVGDQDLAACAVRIAAR